MTVNAVLMAFLSSGEVIHDPGPLARAILADFGWAVQADMATPTAPPTAPMPHPPSAPSVDITTGQPHYLPLISDLRSRLRHYIATLRLI